MLFELVSDIGAELVRSLMTPRGVMMSFASGIGIALVLIASSVRTMVRLRAVTVASNFFLLVSALLVPNAISVVMYCLLIPLNSYRLVEIIKLTRKVSAAMSEGDLSGIWLKPYMKSRNLAANTVLFHRGDAADILYMLVDGTLELMEIGKIQPVGELFGEIAFFSPDRRRTLTARCRTDCRVLEITGATFRQLYFQSPKLAHQISSLIAQRLTADVRRLQDQLTALGVEGQR